MARVVLLLLMWFGVTLSAVVDLQKRIFGGKECERPYHVKLNDLIDGSYKLRCGASLISKKWILTAAHCFVKGRALYANLNTKPPQVNVKITANPVIYTDDSKREHDIMLLQLPDSVDIDPVALPDCKTRLKTDDTVELAGHAATTAGPNGERILGETPTLQCIDKDVVSCDDVEKKLQQEALFTRLEYQHWFCGQRAGVDACVGDSGGGAVHGGKIYGVLSFLANGGYVCVAPAAFMDVCNEKYLKWIHDTIA